MIQKFRYPKPELLQKLFERPEITQKNLDTIIEEVFLRVQQDGDTALRAYTKQFDHINISNFKVQEEEFQLAEKELSEELIQAMQLAHETIFTFHKAQQISSKKIETKPGVHCWRVNRGIDSVGLYIPGGTAPLFSSVLMLAIPAKLANCGTIVLCSPPNKEGTIHPAILVAAKLSGVHEVYKIGGAQAIAALSLGTESIPKVNKLFGPGNQYVTAAKRFAQQHGTAIDMPAGPSEVLVIADETANPQYVAADLLSQAEHGMDSQVILLSTSESLIDQTIEQVQAQYEKLPRKAIIAESMKHSKVILLETIEDCIHASNQYAPEHLILAIEHAEQHLKHVQNAGSVFLGNFSCESLGDYASGTNHTLPTNGFAKAYSGVSLDSFVKKITVQEVTEQGIQSIGEAVKCLAEAEGLEAHKQAVQFRLNQIS